MTYYNHEHYRDPTAGTAARNIKRQSRGFGPGRTAQKEGRAKILNRIFAIDPGNIESGFVIVEHDGREINKVSHKGKVQNESLLERISMERFRPGDIVAIEMIASYGMPVGREVFDTCIWIGRFYQHLADTHPGAMMPRVEYILRAEEKRVLCKSSRAKDTNVTQALVDRFAPGQPNHGKGTKSKPGFFFEFKKDIWAAMAVATTCFDLYVKGVR